MGCYDPHLPNREFGPGRGSGSPGSAAPALLSVLAGLLSVAETLTSGTRPFLVGEPVLRLVGWSFQQLPWLVPVTCQWPVPKL